MGIHPLHTIKFIPEIDMRFLCWKSHSLAGISGGVPRYTLQAMTWRGSFRMFIVNSLWTGLKMDSKLAEIRIEYLTTWKENFIFSSANRARPGSQKLPLNVFTQWSFRRNKEKAYQNQE